MLLLTAVLALLLVIAGFLLRSKSLQILRLKRSISAGSSKNQPAEGEKERLQAILESMAEGVVVIDTDKKILLLNGVLAEKFGINDRKLTGRFYWEVFRDPEINSMLEKGLRDHFPFRSEHAALLTDAIFEIQVSPVFSGNDFLGIAAVFHDVTKIKNLERIRREFVANVSHELRTPLTSIMGFVETLKEGAIDDKENRQKFLQIIEEHAGKLHKLIEDLLVLSKLESGKEEIQNEIIELPELIEKISEMFQRSFQSRNIHFSADYRPAKFRITGEYKSLEQLFINLIDNAVKYNKEGGSISIRASQSDNKAIIEVQDTGIGIPEQDLPRIFERFYRVDKSRSRQTGGFGLGLSICKHIAEKHSGQLQVESREGQGSVFRVSLPQ